MVWFALYIAFEAAADQGIGFYAQIFVRASLFFAGLHSSQRVCFIHSLFRTRVCSALFSFENGILSGS